MLIRKILLSVSACALLASAALTHAYDCSNLPAYAPGNIATGAKVKNVNTAFECTVGGWCSQGGAYEPGVGWAQQYAWNNLGSCGTATSSVASSVKSVASSVASSVVTISSSSKSSVASTNGCSGYVTYDNSTIYVKDNVVVYNGSIYRAKWWTQYETPSTGGSGVWELIGPCGGGTSSTPSSVGSSKSSASSVKSSVVSSSSSSVSTGGLKIVGYAPSWSIVESTIQYSKLTHINYAFVLPNSDGSLGGVENSGTLQTIVTHAHQNGVKVVVSIGGWNDGNDSNFVSLASTSAGRTKFTNAVISLTDQYNLDGIDIDWEYPDPDTAESTNYSLLMSSLSSAMHTRGKILTAAVVGDGYTGNGIKNEVFGYVDFLNLMAYDANNGDHSPYSYAVESINYWAGRGLAASKIVLGVPYYAHPSWAAYNTKVSQNSANACRDTDGSDYWNGIPTIRKKAQLARSYGGIMTWELSQDTTGATSLVTAMWEAITGRSGSYPCN